MRRVRLSLAMSLDGYIAGPNGETDWIVMDPDIDFDELFAPYDTILLGRKSWEAVGERGLMPGMNAIVFSRSLSQSSVPNPNATVSDDVEGAVSALKSSPGKDIWLFGGGELFGSMLRLGLVDSMEIAVVPVLLGDGIPLLPRTGSQVPLKLIDQRLYPKTGIMMLYYEPVR